jgi:tRNA pseudouridine55 synthase
MSILLIDKPKGITSFDVIRRLRKKLNIKKMGHAGTLDPLASGLMIIGTEEDTKKLNHYLKLSKVYYAEILLGKKTDTGDLEGKVIQETRVVEKLKKSDIEDILQSFVGKNFFKVPLYSAIKVNGKSLYKYARAGKEPPRIPEKEMEVRNISLLDAYQSGDFFVIRIRVEVSSGTYIRVLGEEIGKKLSYPATLKELRRTQIGDFLIGEAEELEDRF